MAKAGGSGRGPMGNPIGSKGGSAKAHVQKTATSGKPTGAGSPTPGGVMYGKPGGKGTNRSGGGPH